MRSPISALTFAGFWLLACNAILGNESDYTLRNGAGGTGAAAGTRPGTAGTATTAGVTSIGGASEGGGANSADAGDGNAPGAGGSAAGEGGMPGECLAPARCVPAPTGSELGYVPPAAAQGCAPGYSKLTLHSGLTSDGACNGCSCVPFASRCDSSIVGHGAYPCPGFQTSGNSDVLLSTECRPVQTGASVHFYAVRGFAECTPQGVGTPPAAQWTDTFDFCQLDAAPGGGCPAGSRCVAAETAPSCALLSTEDSCGADYPLEHPEPVSTDYVDERTCGECQCGFGNSDCTGGKIRVYSGGSCTGTMQEVGGPDQGDACPLSFVPQSGIVVGTAASNTCPVNTYPGGTFEPVDSRTLCCK